MHARSALLLPICLLAGCAPTFAERQDLLGFRIAAVGAVDGEARAAIWSGDLFHTAATTLEWTADGTSIGEGWGVVVPDDASELALVATAPDGTVREAVVSVGAAPPPLTVTRAAVDIGADVSIAARSGLAAEPVDGAVPDGAAVRLVVADAADRQQRWMVASGEGTLLELDAVTADVLNEELTFDDGEVEARRALDAGTRHVLVLSLDGAGGNRWRWVDAVFGAAGPLIAHGGWLLPFEADASTGLVAVTLDDVTAAGVGTWSDPVAVSDLSAHEAPACAPADAPFELDWLVDGRCLVEDVDGRRLVLEVE